MDIILFSLRTLFSKLFLLLKEMMSVSVLTTIYDFVRAMFSFKETKDEKKKNMLHDPAIMEQGPPIEEVINYYVRQGVKREKIYTTKEPSIYLWTNGVQAPQVVSLEVYSNLSPKLVDKINNSGGIIVTNAVHKNTGYFRFGFIPMEPLNFSTLPDPYVPTFDEMEIIHKGFRTTVKTLKRK